MIYCVVRRELEVDLYDRLVAYYAADPRVTVIVNRRTGPDRRRHSTTPVAAEQRRIRDRRRRRVTRTFASTDVVDP